ncbi:MULTISPECIES: hypothetical protein [Streptomyces]|uniref:hypothetical protein n=1 Tax=Streptomyces TaxID=1883 RepID=UPI0029A5AFA9|nr:hypothetical protein [Streptomyces sp. FL07-04A]MDX3577718.1 hypothetical protein [Streptomyces sp. FL07-04A]
MRRHYAIEITLTRPASCRELHRARQRVALAENADRTRLMTMQSAKSPGSALHRMRRRLDGQLPIDILATHYPDHSGHLLLNVDLGRTTTRALRRAAAAHGQRPGDFLGQRLAQEVERSERERHRHLTAHLESLLHQHTREEVLSCAASLLNRRHPPAAAP